MKIILAAVALAIFVPSLAFALVGNGWGFVTLCRGTMLVQRRKVVLGEKTMKTNKYCKLRDKKKRGKAVSYMRAARITIILEPDQQPGGTRARR